MTHAGWALSRPRSQFPLSKLRPLVFLTHFPTFQLLNAEPTGFTPHTVSFTPHIQSTGCFSDSRSHPYSQCQPSAWISVQAMAMFCLDSCSSSWQVPKAMPHSTLQPHRHWSPVTWSLFASMANSFLFLGPSINLLGMFLPWLVPLVLVI